MTTRPAVVTDAAAIARIYNEGIEDRLATFETEPRNAEDIRRWLEARYPVVVARTRRASRCAARSASARSASTGATGGSTASGATA